ncbi:MAG: hypothetical protein EOP06_02320 [Proteobacteria bacterium]|nr:MAG: hypothetical protein EOP06_02320 [Pseudomonadota bacterium]
MMKELKVKDIHYYLQLEGPHQKERFGYLMGSIQKNEASTDRLINRVFERSYDPEKDKAQAFCLLNFLCLRHWPDFLLETIFLWLLPLIMVVVFLLISLAHGTDNLIGICFAMAILIYNGPRLMGRINRLLLHGSVPFEYREWLGREKDRMNGEAR